MNHALSPLLNKYQLKTSDDYKDALREIIQQIALLGLWRAKFYEHAAFYGGTALRIFYGLSRYSEDLDFSLLSPKIGFSIKHYLNTIRNEFEAFGFPVEIEEKTKKHSSPIESAFIKANTIQNLMTVGAPKELVNSNHRNSVLKVRIEIDIDPPPFADFETKTLLVPIPYQVKLYSKECLFAGKIHALLCREWKTRVKGRDFYDFIWFVGLGIKCNLLHLKARMVQTGHWQDSNDLDQPMLITLLKEKFEQVNFENARDDVRPFILDSKALDLWDRPFFIALADQVNTV